MENIRWSTLCNLDNIINKTITNTIEEKTNTIIEKKNDIFKDGRMAKFIFKTRRNRF